MKKFIPKFPPHAQAFWYQWVFGDCHLCGQVKPIKSLLCSHCKNSIKSVPVLKIDDKLPLVVASFYDVPLNKVMSAYKDQENLSALMVLYQLIKKLPKPKGLTKQTAIIIPVATTKDRLIKRGFNPVLTLAKFLSYHWQIPIWQGIYRKDNKLHQRGLNREQRLKNVEGDFYLIDEIPKVRYVILFDDVITTGSTLKAVASVIKQHSPKTHPLALGILHGQPYNHLPIFA